MKHPRSIRSLFALLGFVVASKLVGFSGDRYARVIQLKRKKNGYLLRNAVINNAPHVWIIFDKFYTRREQSQYYCFYRLVGAGANKESSRVFGIPLRTLWCCPIAKRHQRATADGRLGWASVHRPEVT